MQGSESAQPLAHRAGLNALAAVACVVVAVALAQRGAPAARPNAPRTSLEATGLPLIEPVIQNGRRVLLDATGHAVELAGYQRIASLSTLADAALLELAEPERLVSFSKYSRENPVDGYRYSNRPAASEIEALLSLRPDLVLAHSLGNAGRVTRLRQAGLRVFDLGSMRGERTLLPSLLRLGWLVGRPERAKDLALRFLRRAATLAQRVAVPARRTGLYVGVQENALFGGTTGTSYADLLRYAGLIDVAAARFTAWPSYTNEQLLTLDPEVIVTQRERGGALCAKPELRQLRACGPSGQLIEIEPSRLSDSGLGMLEAAEDIFAAAYPQWLPSEGSEAR